jgi:hypothetical protein
MRPPTYRLISCAAEDYDMNERIVVDPAIHLITPFIFNYKVHNGTLEITKKRVACGEKQFDHQKND